MSQLVAIFATRWSRCKFLSTGELRPSNPLNVASLSQVCRKFVAIFTMAVCSDTAIGWSRQFAPANPVPQTAAGHAGGSAE